MGKTAVFFIITLLFFAGCTTIPAIPTPVVPLAQATLVVERPSATPLPAPTLTAAATETAVSPPILPSATPTQTPTAALPPFTETPAAAATPDPNATPRPGFSPPILSSQGQLAFVQDEVLYVETAVGSGTFLEVDRYVAIEPVWSPDGRKLVYSTTLFPSTAYEGLHPEEHRLWLTENNTVISLSQLIPDLPSQMQIWSQMWSPDSTKLVYTNRIHYGQYVEGYGYVDLLFFVIDLEEATFNLLHAGYLGDRISHTTNESVALFSHCGGPCEDLFVVNYRGELIWQPDWRTAGLVAYSFDNQFLLNIGRTPRNIGDSIPDATVDKINFQTGEVETLWEIARQNGYFAIEQPTISPDGRFLTFNFMPAASEWNVLGTLYLIDLNGRIYHQCEACLVLDWQPGGGPVAVQTLPSGENQLVYLPLDGSLPRIFVTPKTFSFGSGEWSENGRYFVYSTFDETTSAAYLYLWQPDSGEPTLIHAAASDEPFSQFAWMPDSSGCYFNAQGVYTELWGYGAETAEIYPIRVTQE